MTRSIHLRHLSGNIYNVYQGCVKVGYIILELKVNVGTVHYDLQKNFWGRGYGSALQDKVDALFKERNIEFVLAPLLSVRAFRFWLKRDPKKLIAGQYTLASAVHFRSELNTRKLYERT